MGVTPQALSESVNEPKGVWLEMAIRWSKAFGPTPEAWLRIQMAYDLWLAREGTRSLRRHGSGRCARRGSRRSM